MLTGGALEPTVSVTTSGPGADHLTTVVTVTPPAGGADDPALTNNTVTELIPGPTAIFAECFESGGLDVRSTSNG